MRRVQVRRAEVVRQLTVWALTVTVVLLVAGVVQACPTCKDGLSQNDPAAAGLVQGYFWSILFMMAMPFLLLGSLGGYFYYEIRKARARQQASGLQDGPAGLGKAPAPG